MPETVKCGCTSHRNPDARRDSSTVFACTSRCAGQVVVHRKIQSSTVVPPSHTPEHITSTMSPSNTAPPKPLPRPGESIETTRARLVYQSANAACARTTRSWDIYYWATEKWMLHEWWMGLRLLEKLMRSSTHVLRQIVNNNYIFFLQ